MADLPIDVLTQEQTKEQIQAAILKICAALGLKTTAWQSGGVALTIIGGVSVLFAAFTANIAFLCRAGFLDLSVGPWLTLVAYYVFGVSRIEATYANGPIVLVNSSGAQYKYLAGTFVVGRQPPNQVTYTNVEPFTLDPVGNPTATATVAFRCDVAGSQGTANANAINRLVSTAAGVTATNPQAFIGTNGERDIPLRARCRAKLATASPNGARDAYPFAAETATDSTGASLGVTRVQVLPNTGDGVVRIFLASASGGVGSDVVDRIDALIQQTVVPDAVRTVLASATPVAVNIASTIYIYARANMGTPDVRRAAQLALDEFFRLLPVGGMRIPPATAGAVLWRAVEAALVKVHPLVIEVTAAPEADVLLSAGQVAVPGTYAITVVQVPG